MKRTIIFVWMVLIIACNQNQNKSNDSEVTIKNEQVLDSIASKVENPEKDKEKPDIKSLKSPVGLAIETGYASSIEQYEFYEDSVVLFTIVNVYYKNWEIGKWHMKGDSIVMNFHKSVFERGIGKPIYSNGIISAEGPYEEFADNVLDIHLINETYAESWQDIKSGIDEGIHKLLDWNIKNMPEKYDVKLNGKYAIASYRRLEKEDLLGYSKKELRLMRNEIFARYGFRFKSHDLEIYFDNEDWYEPKRDNVDLFLSDIEKENIDLIQTLEKAN